MNIAIFGAQKMSESQTKAGNQENKIKKNSKIQKYKLKIKKLKLKN